MRKIAVGDIVRLKCGTSPLRCVNVNLRHEEITAVYLSSWQRYVEGNYCPSKMKRHFPTSVQKRLATDFVLIETQQQQQQQQQQLKETTMTTLYQVIGKEEYGTLLAKNSAGKLVLEIRGSQEVRAYTPEEVEEVLPYTIEAVTRHGDGPRTRYWEVAKDSFKIGDLFFDECLQLYRVTALNTKTSNARKLVRYNAIESRYVD